MPLSLSSLCAVDTCGHTYNWHLAGDSRFHCRVADCGCPRFLRDSVANPDRVIIETREEQRNSVDQDEWIQAIESVNPKPFVTKDSGQRAQFDSGMVRDTDTGKARFELLWPKGVPYSAQFVTRVAELLARGAEKYDDRNWEKAAGEAELDRFQSSALRHLMQWVAGETDEDHAAAVVFNLLGYETTKWKWDHGLLRPES